MAEVCAESADDVRAAEDGGADRLELCADLACGGLTPADDFVHETKAAAGLPIAALLRPRAGSFAYDARELDGMAERAVALRAAGADAIVSGALTSAGTIDLAATRLLVAAAAPVPFVFHRAFDALADPEAGLEELIEAGCARVLTAGHPLGVEFGLETLARLARRAAGRIEVMPGGGVRAANAAHVLRVTGARAIHFSAKTRYGAATRVEDVRAIVSAVRGV